MTGPEHYTRAEQLLREVRDGHQEGTDVAAIIAAAQVHATLASAAATAMGCTENGGMARVDFNAWDAVAGVPLNGDDDL
ncbi:hypothetical protein [Streptomyces asoensis]|uniref:Dehydrogenase n=1 Tax=Streptomyces asoensis TaxID=249586 RepID=A0ABQ3RYU3_9ACTN|nr:hypothetical protein [Streptomyces asoensis]GGQ48564.1 hypothetical protein GCM10010496_08490 [Streptomyces asoensis]GHI61041.1 hypothetical protein Saso_26910 [Streptomyces asoensis]